MSYKGDFATGATVRFMWNTGAIAGGSITRGTDGSLRVYKDGSTTQRSSASGITDSEDFDGLTGLHHVAIDLSDNADAGFYAAGHDYMVVIQGAGIDGKTVNAVIGEFSIQNRYSGTAPTANAIADALLDRANGIETGFTPRQALRLMLAESAGKLVQSGGNTHIRDVNDAVDRIVATPGRAAVTLNTT